jgi:myo-inositol-1(or 4)-monophosphatase
MEFLDVCERAARAAGAELLSWQGRVKVREKGPCDPVTEADLAAQEAARAVLAGAFPEHDFLSEEEPHGRLADDRYRWILDPLDGTQNYVHGLPLYGVSLALEHGGSLLAGCVFNPVLDRCYTAAAGAGAFCNGTRLRTTEVVEAGQALVAVSLPPRVARESLELANAIELATVTQGIRRFGSSALNLCFVAEGSLDAFVAAETCVWDIAAGVLLVQEAGGTVTGLDGQPIDLARPRIVAAATAGLNVQLRARLRH